jgi:hypothetical protein
MLKLKKVAKCIRTVAKLHYLAEQNFTGNPCVMKDWRAEALTVLLHLPRLLLGTPSKVANKSPAYLKFCRAISVWGGMDANTNNRGDT